MSTLKGWLRKVWQGLHQRRVVGGYPSGAKQVTDLETPPNGPGVGSR